MRNLNRHFITRHATPLSLVWAMLLLTTGSLDVKAQQLTVRNFSRNTYNYGTQNWSIAQCSDGRVLFGNSEGMLSFDSKRWIMFPMPNYSDVRAVFFDNEHRLILAGGNKEVGYFTNSNATHHIEFHSLSHLLSPAEINGVEVWNIGRWKQFAVFQNKNSIMLWDFGKDMKTIAIPHRIESSFADDRGIVVACKEGLYNYRNGRLTTLPGTERLNGKTIKAILPYQNRYILATTDDGLFLYDGKEATAFLPDITPFLKESHVFCAAIQGDDLAVGTVQRGMVVRNLATGSTNYVNSSSGLTDNTVLSVAFDRQQNIWMGLNNGIAYVLKSSSYYNLLAQNNNIGVGYASCTMDNRIYLGTSQGLFTTTFPIEAAPVQKSTTLIPGMSGQVWCLTKLPASSSPTTLLCGADNGAFVINGNKATKIAGVEGTLRLLPLKMHPGYILGCDYDGFYILQQQSNDIRLSHRLAGFGETSGMFYEDNDGAIWVSHWQKGIYRLTLSADTRQVLVTEYFHKGSGLYVDELNAICKIKGRVYVSSVDGFHRYNPKNRQLEPATAMTRLFNKFGRSLNVLECPGGDLWAFGSNYIALARKNKNGGFHVDSITYKSIVANMQQALGQPSFIGNDMTILNSYDGFVVASHTTVADSKRGKQLPEGNSPLPASPRGGGGFILCDIFGTNEKDTLLYTAPLQLRPGEEQQTLHLRHRQNSLRFEFIMPEYCDAKAVVYSYLLEGYDGQWSEPDYVNQKEYTRLPKGRYAFRVKATNQLTGQTSETVVSFDILPAWYETWWCRMVLLFIALLAAYAIVRHLQRRTDRALKRLQAEKERQLKEQEREFMMEQAKRDKELADQERELAQMRSNQLSIELKHKASELADSTMNLVRKNEILQDLDASMEELSASIKMEEPKTVINRKIRDLRHGIAMNMKDDDNWQIFEENFNLVYDNFMQKLIARFPHLKTNDRKLCAYLKMGLSSKEMASLLNTSVRSVETARYRLRKKLDLGQGSNLTDFIQMLDNDGVGGER